MKEVLWGMKRILVGILLVFTEILVFCHIGYSATIYVPDDYTTIQGAIDAASSGDTIIVGPGTYYETIDTTGKSLTIQSSDGAESTIIDGSLYGDPDGFDDFSLVTGYFQSIDVGHYSTPVFSDVDMDGDEDLVVGDEYGYVYYYENNGSGIFTRNYDYFSDVWVGRNAYPTFADIDGDGDEDLYIGEQDGNINYYEKQTDGSFLLITENWQAIDVGSDSTPVFCDLDGDGDLDLLVGKGGGNLNFYYNNGSGTFTLVTENFESINVESSHWNPAFSDIDHDGDMDLFIGEFCGKIDFFENVGDTGGDSYYDFNLITEYFQAIDVGYGTSPTFYDYDRDGDDDLFTGEWDGYITHYENVGDIRGYQSVTTIDSTILDGFTIQGGYWAEYGGGINCSGDSLIENCIIQNNIAYMGYGGGIYLEDGGSLVLNDSIIQDNIAGYGGSIYSGNGSFLLIKNCTIMNNEAHRGAGVFSDSDFIIVEKSNIEGNEVVSMDSWYTVRSYGGLYLSSTNAVIRYNTIQGNVGYDYGGGIYVTGGSSVIKNNIIEDNSASRSTLAFHGDGGGIHGGGYIENNILFSNSCYGYGGGLKNGSQIRGNIFVDNSAGWWGGGSSNPGNFYNNILISNSAIHGGSAVFKQSNLSTLFTNDIFAYNTSTEAVYVYGIDSSYNNDHNDYYSNTDGDYYHITPGLHEIYEDPLFTAFTDDSDWTNDDFSLASGSPCIDSGHPEFEYRDPDGSRADMGAYGGDCADEWDLDGDGYIGGPWGDDPDDMDDTNPSTPHPLKLHYNFDDLYVFDSAGKIVDESIYSNIGDYSGASSVTGIFDEAMEFDGSDYIEVPDSDNLDFTDVLTIEAWIYPTNLSATGRQWIVRKPGNSYGLFIQDGWIYFYTYTGTWMSAPWVVSEDHWSHVAGVYDSSAGTMRIYINGRLMTTRSQSGSIYTTDYPLYIGAANSTPVEAFYGIIDDLRIYSTARTQEQIENDMMDGGRGFKVLHYNFDDGTATDQSNCRSNGTVSGATTDTGIDGSSLLFNGSTNYVTVPDSGTLDITDGLTVSAWVYPTNATSSSRQCILQRNSGGGNTTWGMFIQSGWLYFYTDTRNNGGAWRSVPWTIQNNRWSHVTGVYDQDAGSIRLYINGIQVNSSTQTGDLNLTNTALCIGNANSSGSQPFYGKIDDVRIYNIALSQDMIAYDMQESIPDNVLYYNFNDGSATDQTSCENDGSISGAVSATIDGRAGLSFDGNDYITVNDSGTLDITEALTVEAWVYPTNVSSSTRQYIVQRCSGGTAWGLFIQSGWVYFFTDTRNNGGTWMSTPWIISGGTWSHIAGVYDQRNSIMRLYINGDQVNTSTQTENLNTTNNPLYIGVNNSSGSMGFYGYVDDVRIYNTALSESEIEDDSGL